jgi:hypothetical protein
MLAMLAWCRTKNKKKKCWQVLVRSLGQSDKKKLGRWRQKAKPQPFLVYFVQFVHTQIVKLLEKKNKRLL